MTRRQSRTTSTRSGTCPQPTSVTAQAGDRWFAVTAVSGSYGPAERTYSWGQRVLAGTREYVRFAVDRLRERGQDALETELFADRLVYLELTTAGDSMETIKVRARQYDLSDATLVAGVLDAFRGHDSNKIESLRQPLGPGAADLLAAAYWTLPGWYEKALLARVAYGARDRSHAGLRTAFKEIARHPRYRTRYQRAGRHAA